MSYRSRRIHHFLLGIVCSSCLLLFLFDKQHSYQNLKHCFIISENSTMETFRLQAMFKFSEKQHIIIFFGTRPEVIKLAPIIQVFKQSKNFAVWTIFTGQHADIIHPFLKIFDLTVDIWFKGTFKRGQSLNLLMAKIFMQTDQIPSGPNDIWMIQGDTTSAMVIATVAFQKKIRLAHVEAGLRTFNMYSPFPEEFNRKTISSIATYHFAPTPDNRKNLLNEGIDSSHIFVTGNTVIDAAKYLEYSNKTRRPKEIQTINTNLLILVTLHRRENIGRMDLLYFAISSVKCANCLFIIPVHPNPYASKAARKICKKDSRFVCVSPLPYQELHWMLGNSQIVLTDSGGIQEEVTWYNVPTLVLREETERNEAIQAGIAKLVDQKSLNNDLTELIRNIHKRNKTKVFPYGDGSSSKLIHDILLTIKLPNANLTVKPVVSKKENILNVEITEHYFDGFKMKQSPTIAVILQVFKRYTLQTQLDAVVKQTLVPSTVVVIQNGYHVNISGTIQLFRSKNPQIEIQHIAASKNMRFHGRFHIAFMLEEDYVSIWDDDMLPKSEWLQYCVEYSRSHDHALVGANGRTFESVNLGKNMVVQSELVGKNDFVGHTWTLPRVFLRYYLNTEPISHHTGEDVQLSFALQKYAIYSYKPPYTGEKAVSELSGNIDSNASYKGNQAPRFLLFCTLLRHGFRFIRCKNCNDKQLLDKCIMKSKEVAIAIIKKNIDLDKKNNVHSWS